MDSTDTPFYDHSNPNIVDPLPAGALTWGGKSHGPAVNVGRLRPHVLGPRVLWFALTEVRDLVVKIGWHTEDEYQRLLAELEEKNDLLADAAEEISLKDEKIETLEKAIGWKPKPGRPA